MTTDIDRIREALQFIPACDRDIWLRMGMAIKSELGDTGFDVWDAWSQQADNYKSQDARDVWKSIRAGGKVSIGTLFHEAKANGWRDDGMHQKPTPEELAKRKRFAAERVATEEANEARERADTAKKAKEIWKAATPANCENPYLKSKRVSPVTTLGEIDAGAVAAILGYAPKSGGDALTGRLLVVPVKQGDGLSTLELIDGNKRKAALAGRGTKTGGYWAAQPLPDGDGSGLTLLIGEGVATVLSAKEATGHLAIAALSAGNLPSVVKTMRERYPAATLVILADLVKSTGAPDPHAIDAARALGGVVAIPNFGTDREPDMTDFNDMAVICGLQAVASAIANANAPEGAEFQADEANAHTPLMEDPTNASETETTARLAALSLVEYDRTRNAEAAALGIRPATLDKMVKQARKDKESTGLDFDDVEAWPHPINPSELLTELSATVRRFIICQPETSDAVALWATMTWFMDVVQIAPLAVITAPEKRCGKSQLLFLLGKLSYRPLTASNITPAALFRSIDAWKPTLLVDEADAFMRDNEELRGLLNCGHTRDSAYIIRTVGEDFTPTRFAVWGAKALAGIGHLADTLMDRAVTLELRRKLPHEAVERLRYAEPDLFNNLASKLARFAEDQRDDVRRARPALPASLHDRAQDNWEPLFAIADVAGGKWPDLARQAALKLSGMDNPTMSTGTELLADIQEVFEHKRMNKISTADLIAALCDDDEKVWATYNRGKPVSPRQIAKRLGEFGIKSKNVRIGYDQAKGFEIEQFQEAFARYLSTLPENPSQPSQTHETSNSAACDGTDEKFATAAKNVPVPSEPAPIQGWDGGTDQNLEAGSDLDEVEI
jgi:putative DNA primase/helicase